MTLSQLETQLRRMREVYGDAEVRVEDGNGGVDDKGGWPFGIHAASWCRVEGEPVVVFLDTTAEADSVDVA